jgi:hypothetical protein
MSNLTSTVYISRSYNCYDLLLKRRMKCDKNVITKNIQMNLHIWI